MPIERGVHGRALHPDPPPVHQADLPESGLGRGPDVLRDDGTDVARGERVEVELRLDRHRVRRVMVHGRSCVAVTRVVMPPRTEKSPTTVIRRGAHAATRSSRMRLVTFS